MLAWLKRRLLPSGNDNQYAALLAQSLAASRARFHSYDFDPATKTIDLETCSFDELADALADCQRCIAVEYPETEEGTLWALDRCDELEQALRSRFADKAESAVRAGREGAMRASEIAHPRS